MNDDNDMPITLVASHRYFQTSLVALGLIVLVAASGLMLARGRSARHPETYSGHTA